MCITTVKVLLTASTFAFLSFLAFGRQSPPDLILFNGRVFTSNASQSYVEALAIRGEHIVAVGSSNKIVALTSEDTRRIDLGGRTVIPGINDAHMHLAAEPYHYDLPLKSNDPTWQEITVPLENPDLCEKMGIMLFHRSRL